MLGKKPTPSQVREQLGRLLDSEQLSRAERLRRFLQFIVEETLEGRASGLTEQPIAWQLYANGDDFDTSANPAVRVDAFRLRAKLLEYYSEHPAEPVVISLPKGHYVPDFTIQDGSGGQAPSPVSGSRSRWLPGVAVATFLLFGGASLYWFQTAQRDRTPSPPGIASKSHERAKAVSRQPLTSFVGHEVTPSFSPDGSQVVFAFAGDESTDFDLHIKVLGEDGSMRLTSSRHPDVRPAWAPNGRWIAFVRLLEAGQSAAYLVPPLGGAERLLLQNVTELDWTPDAQNVLVSAYGNEGQGHSIFSVNLDGSVPRRLTDPGQLAVDRLPVAAPDGDDVAFLRCATRARQNCDIHIVPYDAATPPRRLTRLDRFVSGMDWLPDGRGIVFSTSGSLWKVDVEGAQAGQAEPLNLDGESPALVDRGARLQLAYQSSSQDSGIRRVMIKPDENGEPDSLGKASSFINSTQQDYNPVVSPDGKSVAFISDRGGRLATWLSDESGAQIRMVTDRVDGWLMWSPDGSRLSGLCADGDDHRSDICIVEVSTGRILRSFLLPDYENMGTWSRDGEELYFLSTRGGQPSIWKSRLEGESLEQVIVFPAILIMGDFGGDELYYVPDPGLSRENWVQELWALNPHDGSQRLILERFYPFALAPIRGGLLWLDFVNGAEEPPLVQFRSHATGESRILGRLPFVHWDRFPEFSADPDGRYLLIATEENTDSDLWLIEGFDP